MKMWRVRHVKYTFKNPSRETHIYYYYTLYFAIKIVLNTTNATFTITPGTTTTTTITSTTAASTTIFNSKTSNGRYFSIFTSHVINRACADPIHIFMRTFDTMVCFYTSCRWPHWLASFTKLAYSRKIWFNLFVVFLSSKLRNYYSSNYCIFSRNYVHNVINPCQQWSWSSYLSEFERRKLADGLHFSTFNAVWTDKKGLKKCSFQWE